MCVWPSALLHLSLYLLFIVLFIECVAFYLHLIVLFIGWNWYFFFSKVFENVELEIRFVVTDTREI